MIKLFIIPIFVSLIIISLLFQRQRKKCEECLKDEGLDPSLHVGNWAFRKMTYENYIKYNDLLKRKEYLDLGLSTKGINIFNKARFLFYIQNLGFVLLVFIFVLSMILEKTP